MMMQNLIFGLHSVEALLQQNPKNITQLYIQQGRQDQRIERLLKLANDHQLLIQKKDKAFLDKLTASEKHQGIVAVIQQQKQLDEHSLFALLDELTVPPFLLILDGVQDPHNLGACLRTADAAGVHAVIVPKDRAVGLTPVVRKVASGAAETVSLIQATNLVRVIQQLKERGIWMIGAAGEAKEEIFQLDLKGPIAIIAGAEGEGLRRLTKEQCDYLANIPMAGHVSSLNVSVAVGVLLFEAVRQRT